ncbi:MAG: cytosine permease [Candidatus Obscuribacterales bacterium]|nr:cytosine permease [Candidatus Obscuribacterales bacterium]
MSKTSGDDYLHSSVPLSERRGSWTMGLLWLTMVTCFPNVLAGFQWFKEGLSLPQVLWGVLSSCAIIMLYSVPACYMGAKSGLTYTVLSRTVFGSWGARLISLNVIWISVGWYALNAIFLADGIRGLFNLHLPQVLFAVAMALLMAVNNFFGFSGVANFARYLAAPVLLLWVGFAFFKSLGSCPATVWTEAATVSPAYSFTVISSFVVGIACWGNEPDYWRFGKVKWNFSVLPLLLSLFIGQVIFPLTGWMMARQSGITDFAQATKLMNDCVFAGMAILSALVLSINYVAVNDSGLYAAINAAENLKKVPRKVCVATLASLGALATVLLFGYKNNFETVAALSCIVLPSSTVIMMAEAFLVEKFCGKAEDLSRAVDFNKLPPLRFAALIALLVGCTVAAMNSGVLPGTYKYLVGVPAVYGWACSLFTYLPLRYLELKYSSRPLCTLDAESESLKDPEPAFPS